jgi:hypothetical protein
MQLIFKCTQETISNGAVVAKLEPRLNNPRPGDSVSGEIFLTTSRENKLIEADGEILIDFIEEEEHTPESEGE